MTTQTRTRRAKAEQPQADWMGISQDLETAREQLRAELRGVAQARREAEAVLAQLRVQRHELVEAAKASGLLPTSEIADLAGLARSKVYPRYDGKAAK